MPGATVTKFKRQFIDPILLRFGLELREFSSELDHFMISEKMKKRSIGMVSIALGQFLRTAGHTVDAEELKAAVAAFYSLVPECPVRQSSGGCGFNAALALFVTARLFRPSVIIESGVYRGFTTWVLRLAVPHAKIVSFDVDLSRLRRTEIGVEYVEADIATYDFRSMPKESALCFFDDHVAQVLRIEQAYAWGFTNLIFDDNLAVHSLHRDNGAPCPTVDMIFDDDLAEGELVEWNAPYRFQYEVRKAELVALREKIAFSRRFPELSSETGYVASNLTYVRLHAPARQPPDAVGLHTRDGPGGSVVRGSRRIERPRLRGKVDVGWLGTKLALRDIYAAALGCIPLPLLLPFRNRFIKSEERSWSRRLLYPVVKAMRYRHIESALDTFPMPDNPRIVLKNVPSLIVRNIFWLGQHGWEGSETKLWCLYCQKATGILELGANVGLYTLLGARAAPGVPYRAVEPHPTAAAALRENLALNHLGHVEVVEAAAVDGAGKTTITFDIPVADRDEIPCGTSIQGIRSQLRARGSITAQARDVRDLATGASLIKMDIEGAEFEVLSALEDHLAKFRPTLFVEVLPDNAKLHALIPALAIRHGYRIIAVTAAGPLPIDSDQTGIAEMLARHRAQDIILDPDDRYVPC